MRVVLLLSVLGTVCCFAAESVISAAVPVRKPGIVFDPIYESSGGNDTARLVDTTNIFTAVYVEDFSVDGDVSKPIWKNAAVISHFVSRKGRAVSCRTEVKLLYSSTALYVGATLEQPMDKVNAQYDQDDQPVHNDDNVEMLLLVPSGTGEDLLHLAINPLGSCWDGKNNRSSWNLKGREIRTKRFGDRWMLEAKFPFKGMKVERPVGGDFIGVRFCRKVNEPLSIGSAPLMLKGGNNGRHSFAKLMFSEPKGAAAKEARAYRARIMNERVSQRLSAARKRVITQEAMSVQFPEIGRAHV